jgi:signal transduction histidine kinase
MSTSLFFHNFIFLIGGFINIAVAGFVFISGRKKFNSTMVTFGLFCCAVAVFQISQVLGANASDAVTSRNIFMFNLTDIFIGIFWTHWFLALIGKVKELRIHLIIIYTTGLSMLAFFLIFPRFFLIDSVPKMYLPFYYEPGKFYFMMVVWFFLVAVFYFYVMFKAYFAEKNPVQKNRYLYVLASMLYAFIVGTTAFALVFDIKVDPLIASFCGFYTIVLAYAIIKYELLDIRILAKRAFIYALVMILIGVLFGFSNLLNAGFLTLIPSAPNWLINALVGVLAGGSGVYIWRRAQEDDLAKYEFITVIMHKFRTPLTEIRWGLDMVEQEKKTLSATAQHSLDIAVQANLNIVELMNVLIGIDNTDNRAYTYQFATFDLAETTKNLIEEYKVRFTDKHITLMIDDSLSYVTTVYSDQAKIKLVLDILINNALQYTPRDGRVRFSVKQVKNFVYWSVSDSGIGISQNSFTHILTKFYRADNARRTHTEGTGVGLYLAHQIMVRTGGTLTFSSPGEGKGTTFTLKIPVKA